MQRDHDSWAKIMPDCLGNGCVCDLRIFAIDPGKIFFSSISSVCSVLGKVQVWV